MAIRIQFDGTGSPEAPTLVLAKRGGEKLGVLNTVDNISVSDRLSDTCELSFDVYKEFDGTVCSIWNKIVDFKLVWCKEWDKWFSIAVNTQESSSIMKSVTATSLGEAELSQILLHNIEINTEDDINRDDYDENFPTILYRPDKPEASLLHRLMEKAPHYSIGRVDSTIAKLQRTFSFDGDSIKDAFDAVAEEIGCLFVYPSGSTDNGSPSRTVEVYDLERTCLDCGYRGEFDGNCPECNSSNIKDGYGQDTTIFVSTENLTDEVSYETDTDSVKNCFRLTAGDDLMTATVRLCNPSGGGYIWCITDDTKEDMSDELVAKLNSYDELCQHYNEEAGSSIDAAILASYNELVDKYKSMNENLEKITSPIAGYSNLVKAYFSAIDFGGYLQTSMMPTYEHQETNAAAQAALLTADNLSPIAVSKLTSGTSKATVESALKAMAKVFIDTSRFKFSINTTSWVNTEGRTPTWTGNFTVTSYTEEDDEATSATISVIVTDNYADYAKQLVEKKIAISDTEDVSITGLFKLELEQFTSNLKKYSMDCLNEFEDCCQDVLNILTESGGGETTSIMYDQYYLPYYNKLLAIQAEKDVRGSELMIILGDEESETDSGEPVLGVKQYIENAQEEIRSALDLESYLGHDLWVELSSYRREDEYSNDNFISDGLTDSELVDQALQFIDKAKKEIYKSANLQHTITATLKNLLIIPAFAPIVDYFSVGNWIRVRVDDAVYRLRLVSYDVDYSDMDNLSVEFSDVTKALSGTADVADILSRASSMASTFDYVTKQAVKGSDASGVLSNWTENGLSATHTKIIDSADNQNMVVDQHGTLYRKFNPMTEKYEDIQMKIINSTIAITDDNWKSTRAALGRFFYVNPKTGEYTEGYGINGEVLCGKLLLGESLGIYNSDNSMRFDADGLTVTNGTNTVTIDPKGDSVLSIVSENGTVISFNKDGTANFTGNVNATSLSTGGKGSIESTNDGIYIAADGSIYIGKYNESVQRCVSEIKSDGTFNLGDGSVIWDNENSLIKSKNYKEAVNSNSGSGSALNLENGKFSFGGGALVYDGSDLIIKGKMRGNAIDIQADLEVEENVHESVQIMSDVNTYRSIINLIAKFVNNSTVYESRASVSSNGITLDSTDITLDSDSITLGPDSCDIDLMGAVSVHGNNLTDADYSSTTYTSFSGSVLSSGSVTVTKKLGVCYISGSVTASKSITDWTTILGSSAIPAPQHGKLIPFNVPAWGSSYTAALRGRIPAGGGLQLRLGAAREYVFEISYPID